MKQLKMKARSGVTLVELLVVMLIVTILAVSLLPMFKEYICKAQYAAEAIPVIGTLRTKISLYQYDHGKLPPKPENVANVASWNINQSDKEKYDLAYYQLSTEPNVTINSSTDEITDTGKTPLSQINNGKVEYTGKSTTLRHFGWTAMLDIDYQDLKGKRSRPIDYVYYNIPCDQETDSAYIIGCFGAGHGGLAAGTGYAVCELNLVSVGKKYIGTFERYKAKDKATNATCPYLYLSVNDNTVNGDTVYCPDRITSTETGKGATSDLPNVVVTMQDAGWKFTD